MTSEDRAYVKRATERDIASLVRVIARCREEAAPNRKGLFAFETNEELQRGGVPEAFAANDTAFFLAGTTPNEPCAALWCRHMENAPPVYIPGRSILSIQAFYSSADEMVIGGPGLLDAAIEWAKSVSKQDELFVSRVTWAHDTAVREVIRSFHKTSTLVGSARYRELFTLNGNDARMRPATQWYFGRRRMSHRLSVKVRLNPRRYVGRLRRTCLVWWSCQVKGVTGTLDINRSSGDRQRTPMRNR